MATGARFYPVFQFYDDSGNPAEGWTLNGFVEGTSTPKKLYPTKNDAIADTNGATVFNIGAAGGVEETPGIWFADTNNLKLVINDSGGVEKYTFDNITGMLDFSSSGLNFGGAVNFVQANDVASATSTPIGAANGNFIDITGSNTIQSFDTVQAGAIRWLRFTQALVIQYNVSSMILIGAQNIAMNVGDEACFCSLGGGAWVMLSYSPISGKTLFYSRQSTDIASATTTDLSTATGQYVNITGTTTITGFGTVTTGEIRVVRFAGALSLTYNSSSMILPSGASKTTVPGDFAVFQSLGAGNWICLVYVPIQKQATDVASASTIDIVTMNGEVCNVTGVVTITAITSAQAGLVRRVKFTGSLILTHNATSLILPGATNIQTQAGDYATFQSLGSGNWACVSYQPVGGGLIGGTTRVALRDKTDPTKAIVIDTSSVSTATTRTWTILDQDLTLGGKPVLQQVYSQTGAVATGTTVLPYDDTIPQLTEGTQFLSLAITPKSASNILRIEVIAFVGSTGGSGSVTGLALFQDSTANALASGVNAHGGNSAVLFNLKHTMVAGTTSSTTFTARIGPAAGATITFNGDTGARKFGGVLASSITITEYLA